MNKTTKFAVLWGLAWGLVLFPNCQKKPRVVPEISSHLRHTQVCSLKDRKPAVKFLRVGSHLLLIDAAGGIAELDPRTEKIHPRYRFTFEIEPEIFCRDNRAVIREKDSHRIHIFDLSEMKEVTAIDSIDTEKFIGVNEEFVLFLDRGELVIYDYRLNRPQYKIKMGEDEKTIFNCRFEGGSIFFLSDQRFYAYYPPTRTLDSSKLEDDPTSGFLVDGGYIYYGSSSRELVKFSIKKGRVKWRTKISKVLKLKPRKVGKYIAVTPEDNNIYFFNRRGTLYWWDKFDSSRLFPAVVMKDNVAVFLFTSPTHQVKFFNIKKKSASTFKLDYLVKHRPIYWEEHLYTVGRREIGTDSEEMISRIGNRYGVDIQVDPEFIKSVDKSVKFQLVPINLFEPRYGITIRDPGKQEVFSLEIKAAELPAFVWVPSKEGEYKLELSIEAENMKGLKEDLSIRVIDLAKIYEKGYFMLQKGCTADRFD